MQYKVVYRKSTKLLNYGITANKNINTFTNHTAIQMITQLLKAKLIDPPNLTVV